MNEREQQTIERIGNQIMVTLSCHWTPKNFREYLDGKLSELWQAALSAAAPNNGTYCIHGIKCALCADGISPAGTGQPRQISEETFTALWCFLRATKDDYNEMKESNSLDIPVEFMELHACAEKDFTEQSNRGIEAMVRDFVKGEGETAPPECGVCGAKPGEKGHGADAMGNVHHVPSAPPREGEPNGNT